MRASELVLGELEKRDEGFLGRLRDGTAGVLEGHVQPLVPENRLPDGASRFRESQMEVQPDRLAELLGNFAACQQISEIFRLAERRKDKHH